MQPGFQEKPTIRLLRHGEAVPYGLLLLADPSREMIDSYLPLSETRVALLGDRPVGVYVLMPLGKEAAEIKNIAVDPMHQGKGLGKLLLADATEAAKKSGFKTLAIGTANTSVGQLCLYQKQGFELDSINKGFYLRHYPAPLFENGMQCKHLLMLVKQL